MALREPAASTTANGPAQIAANGWAVLPTGAPVTWSKIDGGSNGTIQSLKIAGAASVTDIVIGQRIESFDAAQLANKTVTFQMAVYNNTGASITPTIATRYAATSDTWTGPNADLVATSLQPCPNNSWTTVAYTFTVNPSAVNGYEVKIDFGNNFGSNSKFVQVTAAELRVTPGAATGLNASPPLPELPYIEAELTRNARYYQTSYINGTAPGTPTTVAIPGGVPIVLNTIGTVTSFPFPTKMRTTPTTMSYWDGAGTSNAVSFIAGAGGFTFVNGGSGSIVGANGLSAHGFYLGFLGGVPATASYFVHYAAYADFWCLTC